ncbi:hypothetical protein AAET04_001346 [Vibrio vulnificus]
MSGLQLKPIGDSSLYLLNGQWHYSMASGITQWPVALLSGTVNRAKMLSRDWFGMALVERQRHTLKGTS